MNRKGKWIKMSTNKPMFGPVVFEVACGIVHLCKYFLPDVRLCMQGTHKRKQQRHDCGAMPVRIRENRHTLVKKPANMENIYKDRL